MTTTTIAITDLAIQGGPGTITLSWTVDDPFIRSQPYLQYDHAEVRRSLTVDMASPEVLSTNAKFTYQNIVGGGETYYYQARAINASGHEGDWCDPVLGTETGAAAVETAWIEITPTYNPNLGGAPSAYTLTGRYKIAGLLAFFQIELLITVLGAATGGPFIVIGEFLAALTTPGVGYREVPGGKVALSVAIFPSTDDTSVHLLNFDGTLPATPTVNELYVVSGVVEIDV